MGYEILFLDESTFKLEPHIIHGWFEKGSKPTIKHVSNRYQKFHVFGALGVGKIVTKITDKINAKKYLPFLKKIKKHCSKMCIIVDNARWHLTKEIMNFVKNNGIKMIRLLTYSPELNPIEQYWKNVKRHLGTKPIFDKVQLLTELKKALRKNIFMPDISDY